MDTANPEAGAVEVTNVDSAAAALEARYAARAEQPKEPVEETEEVVEETAEAEEPTEEVESEEQEPEEQEEAPRFSTLEELAEATGMEFDEFLKSIKGKVKIDGEESEITLAEMREGQQRDADYRRKTMQLAEERKALQEEQTQAQNRMTAELQKTGQVLAMAQNELTNEFNNVNWQELQRTDPSQYVIKRQEFGERQARINQAIEQGTKQAEQLVEQQKQKTTETDQSYLQEQEQLLIQALPTWKDEKVRAKEVGELTEYLSSVGFQPEDISNIKDHRFVIMARDAMTGRTTASDIDIAKKKVKKVPKLVRPNARQNVNQAVKKVTELTKRAKKTGRVDDVAAALLARRG